MLFFMILYLCVVMLILNLDAFLDLCSDSLFDSVLFLIAM